MSDFWCETEAQIPYSPQEPPFACYQWGWPSCPWSISTGQNEPSCLECHPRGCRWRRRSIWTPTFLADLTRTWYDLSGVAEWWVPYQALDPTDVQGTWESSRPTWRWGLWSRVGHVRLRVRGDVVPWLTGLRDQQSVRRHRQLPESGVPYLIRPLVSY